MGLKAIGVVIWIMPRRSTPVSRALGEYVIKGITTNVRYLQAIMRHPKFQEGDYDTGFLARHHQDLVGKDDPHLREVAMLASVVYVHQRNLEQAKALPRNGKGPSSAMAGKVVEILAREGEPVEMDAKLVVVE